MNKYISILTGIMVLFIAVISFILSYSSLRLFAIDNGINEQLSYLWPLLVDLSLIVFSLTVVNQYLQSESTKRQWALVAIYTIATVIFNVLHAPQNITAMIVACVAPISLFFSFEVLMSQIKTAIAKANISNNIQQLALKHSNLIQQIEIQNSNLDSLQAELSTIQDNINELKTARKGLQDGFDKKSFELGQIDGMYFAKMPQKQIGEILNLSVGTVSNRIKNLNGQSLNKQVMK